MLFKTYELFAHREIEDVATEIIYYYLFYGESLTNIENRLFGTIEFHGWFSKSILNYYGINTSLKNSNKGLYAGKRVPDIVNELSKTSNPRHLHISKLLKNKYLVGKETDSSLNVSTITSVKSPPKSISSALSSNTYNLYISKENLAQKKVGEIARTELYDVLGSGIVSSDEISQLSQLEYTNKVFGLGYPLLLKALPGKTRYEQATYSGKVRYYSQQVEIFGNKYYITSEWYAKSKILLINWIMQFIEV